MFRSALLALLALLAFAGVAGAHAGPRSAEADFSDGPGVLRIALDGPVEAQGLSATLNLEGITTDAIVRRDPDDPAAILVELSPIRPPRQVVAWRGLSADGHPARGALSVESPRGLSAAGEIGPLPSGGERDGILLLAGRGFALVGVVLALGLLIFEAVVLRPVWRAGGVRPPVGSLGVPQVQRAARTPLRQVRERWWRFWWGALVLAVLGWAIWMGALVSALGAPPGELWELAIGSRPGHALVLIGIGVAFALFAAVAVMGRDALHHATLPSWVAPTLGLPLALALAGFSWGGHAGTGPDRTLDVAVDAVHSGATAAWFGGLLGLGLLLRGAFPKIEGRPQLALAAGVVVRFSGLAIVAVGLVVLSGVYRALGELQEFSDLTTTEWGWWLVVKIAVFVLMLVLAMANRFVFHVRLERAALGLAADDRNAIAALKRSVRAETALAGVVLVAVAVLIASAPPV